MNGLSPLFTFAHLLLHVLHLLLLNCFLSTSNARFDTHLSRQMTVETLGVSVFLVQYISNFLECLEDDLLQVI